ncbi:MAG: flagellar motor protein MotB [Marinomonas sp.]|jgi:chemotaxis protein MotB|uniref:flagellar motor protein MotB n=1 Tax=unclassified Marinomonas TaxID=196814 RepID=UPI0005F9E20D|nr:MULTISPECIES: flagellar motor protein MotB [unclassified Marinomonas]KJZ09922.1 flagellar motor protein [Marinomonas sp. S3726]KZM39062.1 flagellar motor protein [Marinomonas sp. SBI22]KZM39846.1 flagellar motor protein [Marinomonas sp. SBI8L]
MAETSGPIIRRVKKVKKGGHHGGAWKIALADFALAMMAFFLVMWIINVASPEELSAIQGYFNDPQGASTAGFSNHPIDLGGSPAKSTEKKIDLNLPDPGSVQKPDSVEERANSHHDLVAEQEQADLAAMLGQKLSGNEAFEALKENLQIEITPDGIRVTLLDKIHKPMFAAGSGRLTPDFEIALLNIGQVLSGLKNRLVVSGHTDSSAYSFAGLGNWELSSMRANEARRLLREGGTVDERFVQVMGLSDTVPYNEDEPEAGINRRVSILLLTSAAYKRMQERNRLIYGAAREEGIEIAPEAVF